MKFTGRQAECEPNADMFCNITEHTCTGCGELIDSDDLDQEYCHQCEIEATARLFAEMEEAS